MNTNQITFFNEKVKSWLVTTAWYYELSELIKTVLFNPKKWEHTMWLLTYNTKPNLKILTCIRTCHLLISFVYSHNTRQNGWCC